MKVLGTHMISRNEQSALVHGASIDIARERIVPRILAKAVIGDLLWVKEPWALYESRRTDHQNIREAVPGGVLTRPPERIRPYVEGLKITPMSAIALERADSRATLEIMGVGEHAVRVHVHMQQVDAFLEARRHETA